MSPITTAPPVARRLRQPQEWVVPDDETPSSKRGWIVFAVATAFYAAIGLYATLALDVVVGDAESRLAHAYFVWWNEPKTLSAIGFVWPPLQTIVLLPFALVRPLATSLAALPISTAVFGGLLVLLVDHALRAAAIHRLAHWLIVVAIALNPIVVYYAANGMAEIVFLTVLGAAVYWFIRWTTDSDWRYAALAGVAFGVGTLLRYEVAVWLAFAVVGLAVVARRRLSLAKSEAIGIALLAPCVYGMTLWTYLNWQIVGDAFGFFTRQVPGAPAVAAPEGLGALVREAVVIGVAAFPAAAAVAIATLVFAIARRDGLALVFGAFVAVNLLTTLALLAISEEPALLELRYNVRAIPVAAIVAAWLLGMLAPRPRRAAAIATAAVFVASVPASAFAMAQYAFTIGERPFLAGLVSGRSQDGDSGTFVGDQREMAAAIARLDVRENAILTDDAATFGVVLVDGRPDRYFDRVDEGDAGWHRAARAPRERVDYFLIRRARVGGPRDLLGVVYPTLARDVAPPFLRLAHRNRSYALYRVVSAP